MWAGPHPRNFPSSLRPTSVVRCVMPKAPTQADRDEAVIALTAAAKKLRAFRLFLPDRGRGTDPLTMGEMFIFVTEKALAELADFVRTQGKLAGAAQRLDSRLGDLGRLAQQLSSDEPALPDPQES